MPNSRIKRRERAKLSRQQRQHAAKIASQVACGYCIYERTCELRKQRILNVHRVQIGSSSQLARECGNFTHFETKVVYR